MSEAVRRFVIETVLQDGASAPMEQLLETAEALAANSYDLLVGADTSAAERQLSALQESAKGAVENGITIRALADDQASLPLDDIIATAEAMAANSYDLLVGADTSEAERQLGALQESARGAVESASGLSKSYESMAQSMASGQAPQMTAKEIEKLGWAEKGAATAAVEAATASTGLRGTLDQLGNSVTNISDNLGSMITALAGLAAAGMLGNFVEGATAEHRAMEDNIAFLRQSLGERSSLVERWAKEGEKLWGVSEDARLKQASLVMSMGISDPKQITQMVDDAAKIAGSSAGRASGITSTDDLLYRVMSGRVPYALKDLMPSLFDEEAMKATGETGRSARIALAPEALASGAAKTKPDTDGFVNAVKEMNEQTEIFKESLGSTFEPLLQGANTAIAVIMEFANANPILVDIVSGLVLMAIALGVVAGAIGLVTIAWTIFAGLTGLELIIIGVTVLIAVLALAESKTGALSNAWEVFSTSQIGQDLIGSVQALLGVLDQFGGEFFAGAIINAEGLQQIIGDLFQKADGLYKFLKESGSLDIVLAFAFSGPVGMMYFVLEHIYKALLDLFDWARGIWDSILEGIMGLPALIAEAIKNAPQNIVNALTGAGNAKPGTPEYNAQAAALAEAGNKYTNSEGERVFDVDKSIYDAAIKEALTGEKQEHGILQNPAMYQEMVNFFKNTMKNPEAEPSVAPQVAGHTANASLDTAASTGKEGTVTQDRVWRYYPDESGKMVFGYYDPNANLSMGGYVEASSEDVVPEAVHKSLKGEASAEPASSEAPSSAAPAPVAPIPYAKGDDQANPDAVYVNAKTGVERSAAEVGGYSSEDQAKFVKKAHGGAEASSRGLISVLPGEPVVPAEIAQSSRFLDLLDLLAGGPQAVMPPVSEGNQPISVSVSMPLNMGGLHISGAGMDEDSLLRKAADMFQDMLDRHAQKTMFELDRVIEDSVSRKTRSYNG